MMSNRIRHKILIKNAHWSFGVNIKVLHISDSSLLSFSGRWHGGWYKVSDRRSEGQCSECTGNRGKIQLFSFFRRSQNASFDGLRMLEVRTSQYGRLM